MLKTGTVQDDVDLFALRLAGPVAAAYKLQDLSSYPELSELRRTAIAEFVYDLAEALVLERGKRTAARERGETDKEKPDARADAHVL